MQYILFLELFETATLKNMCQRAFLHTAHPALDKSVWDVLACFWPASHTLHSSMCVCDLQNAILTRRHHAGGVKGAAVAQHCSKDFVTLEARAPARQRTDLPSAGGSRLLHGRQLLKRLARPAPPSMPAAFAVALWQNTAALISFFHPARFSKLAASWNSSRRRGERVDGYLCAIGAASSRAEAFCNGKAILSKRWWPCRCAHLFLHSEQICNCAATDPTLQHVTATAALIAMGNMLRHH